MSGRGKEEILISAGYRNSIRDNRKKLSKTYVKESGTVKLDFCRSPDMKIL